MGLSFSHCAAHWSYSGFHWFRVRLAAEIGIDLEKMSGYAQDICPTCGGKAPGGKSWDKVVDPIKPLLTHSNCEGDIWPDIAPSVAKRLRELANDWPADDHDRQEALDLADGLDAAAAAGDALDFC